jgi:dihydrofolate synthase/folylpolyglutamate synthase
MTYPETIQYLESFVNYEKISTYPYKESLKLERIKEFLEIINNPQDSLRCLHVAGTKGKGSTCVFITYILREAGYKVGLYTSPHLSDFRERIRILRADSKLQTLDREFEGMISQGELTDLVTRLKPAIEKYNKESKYGPLSFFEVYTALAFIYFKEQKVDFAVLETGLGGRLDATNVIDPLVCAITPISYEHTQKLGNTLREIATEKAGIIKTQNAKTGKTQNLAVITAPQEKEVLEVIRKKCQQTHAKLYEVGTDILYRKSKNQKLEVRSLFGEYRNLRIRLLGEHQLINAAVAIGTIDALRFHHINIGESSLRKGLYNTVWPGRCEVIAKNPLVVLDGAQNTASACALKNAIQKNFSYQKLILVLGISSDKDIPGVCRQLYDLADKVILTKANNPRATEPQALKKYFNGKVVEITDNVNRAKTIARCVAKKKDLILVTGSLFVVGEFRNGSV